MEGERVARSLKPGDVAPDFHLQASDGRWVQGTELWARGPTVIFFYPRDETPGCTVEACTFQRDLGLFDDLGAQVVGVSSDSIESHRSFAANHELTYLLLSDPLGELRRAFGVSKTLGLLPGRTTYVVDGQGVVRHAYTSQLNVTGHVRRALDALKELVTETGT